MPTNFGVWILEFLSLSFWGCICFVHVFFPPWSQVHFCTRYKHRSLAAALPTRSFFPSASPSSPGPTRAPELFPWAPTPLLPLATIPFQEALHVSRCFHHITKTTGPGIFLCPLHVLIELLVLEHSLCPLPPSTGLGAGDTIRNAMTSNVRPRRQRCSFGLCCFLFSFP